MKEIDGTYIGVPDLNHDIRDRKAILDIYNFELVNNRNARLLLRDVGPDALVGVVYSSQG